jgi:hypothetical protein
LTQEGRGAGEVDSQQDRVARQIEEAAALVGSGFDGSEGVRPMATVYVTKVWIEPAVGVRGKDHLRIDFSDDFHIAVQLPTLPDELVSALHHAASLVAGRLRELRAKE